MSDIVIKLTCKKIKVAGKDVVFVTGDEAFVKSVADTGIRHQICKIIGGSVNMKDT